MRDGDGGGRARGEPVREARDGVLLVEHEGHAPSRGQRHGQRDVPPERDDEADLLAPEQRPRLAHRPAQAERDGHERRRRAARQGDRPHRLELEVRGCRDPLLDAAGHAGHRDPEVGPDAPERAGGGGGGDGVPRGASADEQDVDGHHRTPVARAARTTSGTGAGSRATFTSTPRAAIVTTRDEPPAETSGRVTPVIGSSPITVATFSRA